MKEEKNLEASGGHLSLELNWGTLQYIRQYTITLLQCLKREASEAEAFWKVINVSPSSKPKQSIIIFQPQKIKGDLDFIQYGTSLNQLVIYQEILQKLQNALRNFKVAMEVKAEAVGALSHANAALQTLISCLQDSAQAYNQLHENILMGSSRTVMVPTVTVKHTTPYRRILLAGRESTRKGDAITATPKLWEASFLEGQYLINTFLGLCHAQIRAKNEAKSDLPYTSTLEWDAFQRIHKQANLLEAMVKKQFPNNELVSLLQYFNQYLTDDAKVHAYYSRNDEPLRRADHSLRYLMVYMKGNCDARVKKLLEFDPLIRLNQREEEARLHQLHHDITSKTRRCIVLREKYSVLVCYVSINLIPYSKFHLTLS